MHVVYLKDNTTIEYKTKHKFVDQYLQIFLIIKKHWLFRTLN